MACYSNRVLVALISRTNNPIITSTISFPNLVSQRRDKRNYSINSFTLNPPNVSQLAETCCMSLTPQEVEELGPELQKVIDWFGRLQAIDLESTEPAIRSDIDGDNLRGDVPLHFENWEAIRAAVPSYDEPYIKVPKILNKE